MYFLKTGLLFDEAAKHLARLDNPLFEKALSLAANLSKTLNYEDRIKPFLNDKNLSDSGKRQKKREVAQQIISEAQRILEQFKQESKAVRDTLKRRVVIPKPADSALSTAQLQFAALLADAPRESGKFAERLELALETARKDANPGLLWLLQSSFTEALAKTRSPSDIVAWQETALKARESLVDSHLRPYVRLEAAAAEALPEAERLLGEALSAYRFGLQTMAGPLDPGGVAATKGR
jgi:hypothetical protein